MIYPKARSPLTETVLIMANARAHRWLIRYRDACAEINRLKLIIEEYEDASK